MNNEIKEKIPFNVRDVLEDINSNILWNYITNLLECVNVMKERLDELEYAENYHRGKMNDYKSRCKKAIEYIKFINPAHYSDKDENNLLHILQNRSDSQ